MAENNGIFENIVEGYHRLVGTPIKSSGRSNVTITRNKDGKWFANGRPMADFKSNGSLRKPVAEYSGFTNAAKETIKKDIADGYIKVDPTGAWTPVKESPSYNRSNTAQYANYAIRENNNSGIYDVFDTYDFEDSWYYPNLNRPYKKQIEFRDTIHGPNADDRLYNPNFRSPKND